jgi:tetratricopeptide (TPR) repeat protein
VSSRSRNRRPRDPFLDHEGLMDRGLALHEARKYRQALPLFQRAHSAWPTCPSVVYNIANTSYMLGRYKEALALLRHLADSSSKSLVDGCALNTAGDVRSLQTDVQFLLFLVVTHWRGPTAEAFRHADMHLRLRSRGLRAAWSIREVRSRINEAKQCRRSMRKIEPIVI